MQEGDNPTIDVSICAVSSQTMRNNCRQNCLNEVLTLPHGEVCSHGHLRNHKLHNAKHVNTDVLVSQSAEH